MSGGSLKTTAQADKESLQAGWFTPQELRLTRLRATDVSPLIDTGREWSGGKRYGGLPVEVGHVSSSLRLIMVARDDARLLVLVRTQALGSTRFPTVEIGYSNIDATVKVGST